MHTFLLFWSPVHFFETRRANGLPWRAAAAAPALCAVLQTVSGSMVSAKTRPAIATAMAALDPSLPELPVSGLLATASLLGYPMFFGILFLAVLALDVLAAGSQQPGLLARFTAVSLYTQVPYCIAMIIIVSYWMPEPLRLASGLSDTEIMQQVARYSASIHSGPLMSTGKLLHYFSQLWLSAVLAIALKVVGSLSVRATFAVGTVLFVICMAGPIFILVIESLR